MRHQTRLRFELGGFEAEGVQVRLSRGRLLYSKTIGPFPAEPPRATEPTEEQWGQFWGEVDRIGVWAWLPDYVGPGVMDGTQWSLELRHNGRNIKCDGSNAYPGSSESDYPHEGPFADLLRALGTLAGLRDLIVAAK